MVWGISIATRTAVELGLHYTESQEKGEKRVNQLSYSSRGPNSAPTEKKALDDREHNPTGKMHASEIDPCSKVLRPKISLSGPL
jgi:hypothetical protein